MKDRTKVLQVIAAPSEVPGQPAGITGPERRASNLAKHWKDYGIDISVLYPRRGALWSSFATAGVPLEAFELTSKFDFAAIGRLAEKIRSSGAQVVHTQGAAALDMMAVTAARRCGIASAVTRPVMIDDLVHRSAISRWTFNMVDRHYTLRRCDALVTISRNGFDRLKDHVAPERLHLIHNGVTSPFNGPVTRPKRDIVHLGMIGHLRSYKGFDVFLKVARTLSDGIGNLHFHIAGEGPERGALEAQCKALGLQDQVTFHGLLQDVTPVLELLDIFLFTSRREGLSVAVLEAMGASLPIVATDVGGIADQIDEGRNGFIVPGDDIAGLTQRSHEIILDPERRQAMGAWSYKIFEARFAQSRMLSDYVDLYKIVAQV